MQVSRTVERDRDGWAQLQSVGRLLLLLTGLGVAVAAGVGLVVLVLAAVIDQALG